MLRGNGEHDLVAKERLERDTAVSPARADDSQLELALGDPRDDGLGVGDGEANADVRVTLLEVAEQHGHDAPAGPGRRAELERSRDQVLVAGFEILEELLFGLQQPLSRRVQTKTRFGRLDATPRPVEELPAEPLLE